MKKAILDREKSEKKETKEKLKKYIRKSVLEQSARQAVQAFRREEDLADGYGCISCGKKPGECATSMVLYGHEFDGGHYRSVGRARHLSLEPKNIHAQCVFCNRDLHSNALEYRKGLIERYGQVYLDALEEDNAPRNYTRDQLISIAAEYRKKLRDLKRLG